MVDTYMKDDDDQEEMRKMRLEMKEKMNFVEREKRFFNEKNNLPKKPQTYFEYQQKYEYNLRKYLWEITINSPKRMIRYSKACAKRASNEIRYETILPKIYGWNIFGGPKWNFTRERLLAVMEKIIDDINDMIYIGKKFKVDNGVRHCRVMFEPSIIMY